MDLFLNTRGSTAAVGKSVHRISLKSSNQILDLRASCNILLANLDPRTPGHRYLSISVLVWHCGPAPAGGCTTLNAPASLDEHVRRKRGPTPERPNSPRAYGDTGGNFCRVPQAKAKGTRHHPASTGQSQSSEGQRVRHLTHKRNLGARGYCFLIGDERSCIVKSPRQAAHAPNHSSVRGLKLTSNLLAMSNLWAVTLGAP